MIVLGSVPFVAITPAVKVSIPVEGTRENPHVYVGYTRDHRGISSADRARFSAAILAAQQAYEVAAAGPVTQQNAGKTKALERLPEQIRTGQVPFVTFTNLVDGKKWGKYYHEDTGALVIMPIPSGGWGLGLGYIGDAIVWFGEKVWEGLTSFCGKFQTATSNQEAEALALAAISAIASPAIAGGVKSAVEIGKKLCQGVALIDLLTDDGSAPSDNLDPDGWPRLSERVVSRRPYPVGSFAVKDPSTGRFVILAPPGAAAGTGVVHSTATAVDHR